MTRHATITISGNAIRNAIVDLRRANLCSESRLPAAETGRSRDTTSAIPILLSLAPVGPATAANRFTRLPDQLSAILTPAPSRPREALDLGGGPIDRLIDRFALNGAFRDHLGDGRLGIDLVG